MRFSCALEAQLRSSYSTLSYFRRIERGKALKKLRNVFLQKTVQETLPLGDLSMKPNIGLNSVGVRRRHDSKHWLEVFHGAAVRNHHELILGGAVAENYWLVLYST